jgi:hypothetical protein
MPTRSARSANESHRSRCARGVLGRPGTMGRATLDNKAPTHSKDSSHAYGRENEACEFDECDKMC